MKNKFIWLAGIILLLVLYGLFDPARNLFPLCPFKWLTGWQCPGCGSQRALHQFLHGNLAASFKFNSLFLPAMIYGAISICGPYFFSTHWPVLRNRFYGLKATYITFIIIILFWIGRNI